MDFFPLESDMSAAQDACWDAQAGIAAQIESFLVSLSQPLAQLDADTESAVIALYRRMKGSIGRGCKKADDLINQLAMDLTQSLEGAIGLIERQIAVVTGSLQAGGIVPSPLDTGSWWFDYDNDLDGNVTFVVGPPHPPPQAGDWFGPYGSKDAAQTGWHLRQPPPGTHPAFRPPPNRPGSPPASPGMPPTGPPSQNGGGNGSYIPPPSGGFGEPPSTPPQGGSGNILPLFPPAGSQPVQPSTPPGGSTPFEPSPSPGQGGSVLQPSPPLATGANGACPPPVVQCPQPAPVTVVVQGGSGGLSVTQTQAQQQSEQTPPGQALQPSAAAPVCGIQPSAISTVLGHARVPVAWTDTEMTDIESECGEIACLSARGQMIPVSLALAAIRAGNAAAAFGEPYGEKPDPQPITPQ